MEWWEPTHIPGQGGPALSVQTGELGASQLPRQGSRHPSPNLGSWPWDSCGAGALTWWRFKADPWWPCSCQSHLPVWAEDIMDTWAKSPVGLSWCLGDAESWATSGWSRGWESGWWDQGVGVSLDWPERWTWESSLILFLPLTLKKSLSHPELRFFVFKTEIIILSLQDPCEWNGSIDVWVSERSGAYKAWNKWWLLLL